MSSKCARCSTSESIGSRCARRTSEKVFPQQYWDVLTEAGPHGMAMAKEYGGIDGSFIDRHQASRVGDQLTRRP